MNEIVGYYAIAAALGAAVGTVELFQRYRAEPFDAFKTIWGSAYIVFNGAVAAITFLVADIYRDLDSDSGARSLLQWSTLSGLGGVALLRTKLMDLDLPDGKVALGPEIVVQTFLRVLDREHDRKRASSRFDTVHKLMQGISYERTKLRLTSQLFQAMQGVTEEESQLVMQGVASIDEMEISDQDRAYLLGFYLLDLVGEEFLYDVLTEYRDDFVGGPPGADDE